MASVRSLVGSFDRRGQRHKIGSPRLHRGAPMNRIAIGALLCLFSTAALAQTTNCSTYGNSMNCQTYGSADNTQSSTTNCYRYGNSVSCQQYAAPQLNPNGCGNAVGCAIQGFERGREQAEQQRLEQERYEQLRLQNQLLQQQLDSQREQLDYQNQNAIQNGVEVEGRGGTESHPGSDNSQPASAAYPPATRTRVLEAEYCFGFGTAEFSTMQYRTHQDNLKSSTSDSEKSFAAYALRKRSADNATLASYVVANSNLADDGSLHKFYDDGMNDYGKVLHAMDHANAVCSSGNPAERAECANKITNPVTERLGSAICNNLDFLSKDSGD